MPAPKGNKYALGNTGGRPPHFETPEALEKVLNEYFNTDGKHTITGLALYLGFESRASLDDYAKKSDVFSYMLKRSKLVVENSYESAGGTIDIFALKNMGWKDKTETELSGGLAVSNITGMVIQ